MEGIILKATGNLYQVKSLNGKLIKCRLKGKFRIKNIKSTNPIVVGDRVEVVEENQSWIITKLYNRKNYIIRKSVNLSKQTHIIAANIDQAILIVTMQEPITSLAFADRFLVACESYNIPTLIIFNKIDLYNKEIIKKQRDLELMYTEIGYTCISISLLNDDSSVIKKHIQDKVNVVAGNSGTGKSTLINMLQPNLNLNTNTISSTHKQGKHTTTFSEFYELDFGGSIIDTPGIKGFGLVKIESKELDSYFKEFLALKNKCRFHNCLHINEPDCAIKEAVFDKKIAASRYLNYTSMLNEDSIYR